MRTSDLYFNKHQMLQDLQLRTRLGLLVEDASPDQLRSLAFIISGKEIPTEEIERDLGCTAIEDLLDCLEHADREQLQEIHHTLEQQGVSV